MRKLKKKDTDGYKSSDGADDENLENEDEHEDDDDDFDIFHLSHFQKTFVYFYVFENILFLRFLFHDLCALLCALSTRQFIAFFATRALTTMD